jgi:hypothetical protein
MSRTSYVQIAAHGWAMSKTSCANIAAKITIDQNSNCCVCVFGQGIKDLQYIYGNGLFVH